MPKKTDYHVHPDYSLDAEQVKIKTYCRRALELGLKEICFTTHMEFAKLEQGNDKLVFYQGKPYSLLNYNWLDAYFKEIQQAQQEFKKDGLQVKAGVEIGYHRKYAKEIEKVVSQYPFDYVLGAIHNLAGYSIASKVESASYFAARDLATVQHDYFSLLAEAVKTGLFDAIAHLDIYCRYGMRHYGEQITTIHRGVIEPIFAEMAKRKMALEINTSSRSRLLKEFHPAKEIVALAAKAGLKYFTVGSDAHRLEELGRHLHEALSLLREFKLTNCVYTRRRAIPLSTSNLNQFTQHKQPGHSLHMANYGKHHQSGRH